MIKSLTWVQLDDLEWLLVCTGYIESLPFRSERELRSHGIRIQPTGVTCSSISYTWRTYNVWKNNELTEDDKLLVEKNFNEIN